MPPVSLYRKWRPRTFQDVVAQEHITTTLQNAIRANRIAHAYLFTGPRGTGKTTTARIFAKAINCTHPDEAQRPCNVCDVCVSVNEGRDIDLIEIDAASNNGVDNVRELRERVGFLPGQSRYKIYIIDEVHMLSNAAFNALLKTLEEPPAHAIFVLATTEVDKLPATVLSRCQRFDFRLFPFKQLRDQLAHIAEAEGAQIEPGALDLFARQAGGSMRDGISLLDQMIAYGDGRVTLRQAQAILGSVAAQAVGQVVQAIIARDVPGGLRLINDTVGNGADPRQFVREILEYLRGLLLLRGQADGSLVNQPAEVLAEMKTQAQALPTADLLAVIKHFSQAVTSLRNAPQPQLPIEVAFVESALRDEMTAHERPPAAEHSPAPQPRTHAEPPRAAAAPPVPARAAAVAPRSTESAPVQAAPAPHAPAAQPPVPAAAGSLDAVAVQARWTDMLAAIKAKSKNLEAIVKAGHVSAVDGDTIVLAFPYDFHKQKAEELKNKQLIEEAFSETLSAPLAVRCEIGKAPERKPAALRPKDTRQKAMEDPLVKEVVTRYNARIAEVDDQPADER
jgi:DNA polymerase-3 subunit gamma/tau